MATPLTALRFAMLFGGVAVLAACDSTIQSPQANSAQAAGDQQLARKVGADAAALSPGSANYQIGVQDVLEIVVFKVPELTRNVQAPRFGDDQFAFDRRNAGGGFDVAGGQTRAHQAACAVSYLKNPQVNIYVKEYNSQRVTIEGSVRSPGVFPIRGKLTLMQALATSGGTDRDYASSDVMVFRTHDGLRTGSQHIDSIRTGDAPDPPLKERRMRRRADLDRKIHFPKLIENRAGGGDP